MEKVVLLDQAYKVISNDSSKRIIRSAKLSLMLDYAEHLARNDLWSLSLGILEKILDDVNAKGLPGSVTSADSFGATHMAETQADAIEILSNWKQNKKAERILEAASENPPRQFHPLMEASVRLHNDKFLERYLDLCTDRLSVSKAAPILRKANKIDSLKRLIDSVSAPDSSAGWAEGPEELQVANFALEKAMLEVIENKPSKALLTLKGINFNAVIKADSERKYKAISMGADLYSMCGDFASAEKMISLIPFPDAVDKHLPVIGDSDRELREARAIIIMDAKGRDNPLPLIDAFLNKKNLATARKAEMLNARIAKTNSEGLRRYYIFVAFDLLKKKSNQIGELQKRQILESYAWAVNSAGLVGKSADLFKEVVAMDEKLKLPGDNYNSIFSRIYLSQIFSSWGQFDQAAAVISDEHIPDPLPPYTSWFSLMSAELEAGNLQFANKLLARTDNIENLFHSALAGLKYHQTEFVDLCVSKMKRSLSNSSDSQSDAYARGLVAVLRANVLLDSGKNSEAKKLLEEVLPLQQEWFKRHMPLLRRYFILANICGMDPKTLITPSSPT